MLTYFVFALYISLEGQYVLLRERIYQPKTKTPHRHAIYQPQSTPCTNRTRLKPLTSWKTLTKKMLSAMLYQMRAKTLKPLVDMLRIQGTFVVA